MLNSGGAGKRMSRDRQKAAEEGQSNSMQQVCPGYQEIVFRRCNDDDVESQDFVDVIAVFTVNKKTQADLLDSVFLHSAECPDQTAEDETRLKGSLPYKGSSFDTFKSWFRRAPKSTPSDKPVNSAPKPVNWMRDEDMLPSVLPAANIVGYGIDIFSTAPMPSPGKSLQELVFSITEAIIALRKKRPHKPIIFVGHGYGSIVIDKILMVDRPINEKQMQFRCSTAAIVLFGAPLLDFGHLRDWFGRDDANTYFESGSYKPEGWRARFKEATDEGISILVFSEQSSPKEAKGTSKEGKSTPKEVKGTSRDGERKPNDQKHSTERETLESWEEIAETRTAFDIANVGKMEGPETREFKTLQYFLTEAIRFHRLLRGDIAAESLVDLPNAFQVESSRRQTPLHVCAKQRNQKVIDRLLELGKIDVNHQDRSGETALHMVARDDSETSRSIAMSLLSAGANPTIKDRHGDSPLKLSAGHGKMNTTLVELPPVEHFAKSSRPSVLIKGKPADKHAKKACEETIMVMRKVFTPSGNSSLPNQHVPHYGVVTDLIYSDESIDNVLKKMSHAKTDERGHEPEVMCHWLHVPMNNMAWIHRCMHPQTVELESLDESRKNTRVRAWAILMPYMSYQDIHGQRRIERFVRLGSLPGPVTHGQRNLADDFTECLAIQGYMNDNHQGHLYSLRLQPRRTLDQSYYYMLKHTTQRDEDQVVSRWAQSRKKSSEDNLSHNILMVDQLWLWLIESGNSEEPDTIISSFPSRRGVDFKARPFDDIQDSVLKRSSERIPMTKSVDVISRILTLCCNTFDRHQSSESLQFLQQFESTLADAEETATKLFKYFRQITDELSSLNEKHADYLKERNSLLRKLFDIQDDTQLLEEVKDIQDEIKMIKVVTEDQLKVLKQIESFPWAHGARVVDDAQGFLEDTLRNFQSMQLQARSIEETVSALLDLKQKQANLWEARSAREGAEENAKQGSTTFVFTVVTIIFLPLSFMTSFFALGISAFPKKEGEVDWPLGHLLGLLFGISAALILPPFVVAFNIERAKRTWKRLVLGTAKFVAFQILTPILLLTFFISPPLSILFDALLREYFSLAGWIKERDLLHEPDTQDRQKTENGFGVSMLILDFFTHYLEALISGFGSTPHYHLRREQLQKWRETLN